MLFDDIKKSFICFDDFIRDFIKFNCLYIHFLCSVLTSRYMFISMKLNKELHNWCFREQKKGKSRFRNYCDFLEISAIFLTGEEVSVLASLASFISLAFVSPPFFCHFFFHVLCAFLLISGWHQAGITYWLSFQMPVFSLCLLFLCVAFGISSAVLCIVVHFIYQSRLFTLCKELLMIF